MNDDVVYKKDLEKIRAEIISEVIFILKPSLNADKKILKSQDVMELLGISEGKLQYMRQNGDIPFSKIGNITYYKMDDILATLEKNRHDYSVGINRFEKVYPDFPFNSK